MGLRGGGRQMAEEEPSLEEVWGIFVALTLDNYMLTPSPRPRRRTRMRPSRVFRPPQPYALR